MFKIDGRGYSLLETLVVVGILVVIMIVLAEIYIGQTVFFQREEARVEVALQNTRTLADMMAQIREAKAVIASQTLDSVVYQSGPEQLVLQLFSLDAAKQPLPNNFDYAVYFRDPSNSSILMKKVAIDPASSRQPTVRNLDDFAQNLLFSYDNPNFEDVKTVEIYLSSRKISGGINFNASSTARAVLRNK